MAVEHAQDDEIEKAEQEELRSALARMEEAFNEFHSEIKHINLEQKEIAREIRKRIDQEKIHQIHQLLKQE